MNTIETKFAIGDVVFYAGTTIEQKKRPCPDCKDERKWMATSPAGHEYSFPCPRCAVNFSANDGLSLSYSASTPAVRCMTIGSVSHNTHGSTFKDGQWVHGPETRYMCNETGVGSGSSYGEDVLFLTKDEATARAQQIADDANTTTEWIVKQYDRALRVCDYELDNGMINLAKSEVSRARSMLYGIHDLFSEIKEAADKDEIIEKIDSYLEYDWERDSKKLAEPETV